MKHRHLIETGLLTLFAMGTLIALLMWWASQYSNIVTNAMLVMIILGLAAGTLIPNILVTWLIIGLTTIGSAILLLGYIVISTPLKIALLLASPVCASIVMISRFLLTSWGWLDHNRRAVESYVEHYDPLTKLLTKYNAQKLYQKNLTFIKSDPNGQLWIDLTAIRLAHSQQLQQFHHRVYDLVLQRIAGVLKKDRLPSEAIFFMGDATFLIVSYNLSKQSYHYRNQLTKHHLEHLTILGTNPQFKWGRKRIDQQAASKYPQLHDAMRPITRDMETDLVVEYLKEDKH